MAIQFVGASAPVSSATNNATITATWPSGYTPRSGDLAVVLVAGRQTNGSAISTLTISGYTKRGTQWVDVAGTTSDLQLDVFTRRILSVDAAPSIALPAAYVGATTGGMSIQLAVFRNVDQTTIIDVAAVTSSSAAAATWAPTGLSTSTAGSMVLSCVATGDDNTLALSSAQSFTTAMSGATYDTTTGADHSVGLAYRLITGTGSVTMPTWQQTINDTDPWVGITLALRPAPSSFTDAMTYSNTTNINTLNNDWVTTPVAGTWGITSNTGYIPTGDGYLHRVVNVEPDAVGQVFECDMYTTVDPIPDFTQFGFFKDTGNYVSILASASYATWVLSSANNGTLTLYNNLGLANVQNVRLRVVRDGDDFFAGYIDPNNGYSPITPTLSFPGFAEYSDIFVSGYTDNVRVDNFSVRSLNKPTRTASDSASGTETTVSSVVRPFGRWGIKMF